MDCQDSGSAQAFHACARISADLAQKALAPSPCPRTDSSNLSLSSGESGKTLVPRIDRILASNGASRHPACFWQYSEIRAFSGLGDQSLIGDPIIGETAGKALDQSDLLVGRAYQHRLEGKLGFVPRRLISPTNSRAMIF
jgi:hypothetical protein